MRQLTQQAEVFVRTGGNTNRHVGDLAFSPGNALRELKDLDAGFQHLIARVCCAMGNRNTIAKKGRGLLFARQHTVNIAARHIPRLR